MGTLTEGQTYDLYLSDASACDVHAVDYPDVSTKKGSITVVPEPATMGLLSIGSLALLRRRSRKA